MILVQIRHFAHNTWLYIVLDIHVTAANQLNSDRRKLSTWTDQLFITILPRLRDSVYPYLLSACHYRHISSYWTDLSYEMPDMIYTHSGPDAWTKNVLLPVPVFFFYVFFSSGDFHKYKLLKTWFHISVGSVLKYLTNTLHFIMIRFLFIHSTGLISFIRQYFLVYH